MFLELIFYLFEAIASLMLMPIALPKGGGTAFPT